MKNTKEYKEIFNGLTTENQRVKNMLACKQYYKLYPETRPEKKVKKDKINYDSLNYLQELHGENLISMISKQFD